ncbi:cupin 2 conserved barrel domain protein [Colletotrichum kahawae]|uniref:Cupin 2 conserved barrel domain protein n=1 Tax=Colletotrichum kahawae TaxID=34407 RepID=A0AAE0DAI9_COLKA|nr:cupin 2 conserved barrel domain protein [Colletotrichum kahawae]
MPLRGPVPVRLCTKENSEKLVLGPMTIYMFEDGTNTDNRVGCMTLGLPPATSGPPMHWHRFHDECFFVTKGGLSFEISKECTLMAGPGTVRFKTPEGDLDAKEGDLMVVPPRAIHTFANPSETEPAEFFMTSTPGYYMDYFRMMGKSVEEGKKLTREDTAHLMALFGTFPPGVESEP